MKNWVIKCTLILIVISGPVISYSWGLWGHQHINHAAVFALPEEMRRFFYNHIDFITEESTIPDLRKYTLKDKAENPRHFIDIEHFDSIDMRNIPRTSKLAYEKYDDKFLEKNGILPWYIQDIMEKLTKAFQSGRRTEILFLAADLGHYIGDANMPLHTSANHNGQLTNQKGIHSFWEAQLPEYFGSSYNFRVNDAVYLNDITSATWDIIEHSHMLADTLLLIDRQLKLTFPADNLYKKNANGEIVKNIFGQQTFSDAYAAAFHKALNGMVENQMRHAVQDLANFWYTAWVNAGKPNLDTLDTPRLTASNRKKYKQELRLYKKGKLSGFKQDKEYR